MDVLDDYRAAQAAGRQAAMDMLKPGDRVGRTMCGGAKGTFTFTHWDKGWACGKTVYDCSPSNIYAVNGKPVSFLDWNGDFGEVARLMREERMAKFAARQQEPAF